jgi:hypothetical protein
VSPALLSGILCALAVAAAVVLFTRWRASEAAPRRARRDSAAVRGVADTAKGLSSARRDARAARSCGAAQEARQAEAPRRRRPGRGKSAPAKLRAVGELAAGSRRAQRNGRSRLHAESDEAQPSLRARGGLAGARPAGRADAAADRSQLDALERHAADGEARLASWHGARRRPPRRREARAAGSPDGPTVLRRAQMKKDEHRNLRVEVERRAR